MKKPGYFILIGFAIWLIVYQATTWLFYAIEKSVHGERVFVNELDRIDLLVSIVTVTVSIYTIQSCFKQLKLLLDMDEVRSLWKRVKAVYRR